MNQVTLEALRVLGIGMGTVFSVLVIFYLIVKALQMIFPSEDEAQNKILALNIGFYGQT